MVQEQVKQKAKQLIPAVMELRSRALKLEESHQADLQLVAADYRPSARNLLHYLAIRQADVRSLQNELVALGLTSLGKAEMSVLSTLNALLYNLHLLAEEPFSPPAVEEPVNYHTGPKMLDLHTEQLLGEPSGKRKVHIMVTMPSEAATDRGIIHIHWLPAWT